MLPQELVKCSQLVQHLALCGFLLPHKNVICKSYPLNCIPEALHFYLVSGRETEVQSHSTYLQ